jgi:hypothetical protein
MTTLNDIDAEILKEQRNLDHLLGYQKEFLRKEGEIRTRLQHLYNQREDEKRFREQEKELILSHESKR